MFKFRLWIEQVSRTHHALFSCGGSAGRNKLGTKSSFKPTAVLPLRIWCSEYMQYICFPPFFRGRQSRAVSPPFFSALFPAKKWLENGVSELHVSSNPTHAFVGGMYIVVSFVVPAHQHTPFPAFSAAVFVGEASFQRS